MSTKSSVQLQQSLKPNFIVGELYVSAEGIIVIVTGERVKIEHFAGTILHAGDSDIFCIGENNQRFLKDNFIPFKGSVTLEAE